MAAPSRPQPQRNGRSLPRRIADTIRHLAGHMFTTARSLPGQAGRQLTRLVRRGRGKASATRTIPGTGAPVDRVRTARNRRKAAPPSGGRGAERGPGAAERAAATERLQAELAKGQGRTRRTSQRQARPRQAKRRQDLKQQTLQQLRERAREAGITGRSSMTKDQLIRALRDHR